MWFAFASGTFLIGLLWWIYLTKGHQNPGFIGLGTVCGLIVIGLGLWAGRQAPSYRPPVRDDF